MLNQYLLITVLPSIHNIFCWSSIGFLAIAAMCFIATLDDTCKECAPECKRWGLRWFISGVIIGWVGLLIPTQKEIALIYAASYITGNDKIKALPPKIVDVVNKYLDDSTNESP